MPEVEKTLRCVIYSGLVRRATPRIFNLELFWVAGTIVLTVNQIVQINGNLNMILGGLLFGGLLWLRRYRLFRKVMSVVLTAIWIAVFWTLTYPIYGVSVMTIGMTLLTIVYIGGIHKWGVWDTADISVGHLEAS